MGSHRVGHGRSDLAAAAAAHGMAPFLFVAGPYCVSRLNLLLFTPFSVDERAGGFHIPPPGKPATVNPGHTDVSERAGHVISGVRVAVGWPAHVAILYFTF